MSHTLTQSGVYMGADLNISGDLIPAEELYEACRIFGKSVVHKGGLDWDFSAAHSGPIDPAFTSLVKSYLSSVLEFSGELKGWKLPETTLILPWIVRLFPDIRYIYWLRDPRDSVLGDHLTDDLDRFGIPHDPTQDLNLKRAISWRYQFEIMKNTPLPAHRIEVRFEDFVLCQTETLSRLEKFLNIPLESIPVRAESVGRWKSAGDQTPPSFFPAQALYDPSTNQLPCFERAGLESGN